MAAPAVSQHLLVSLCLFGSRPVANERRATHITDLVHIIESPNPVHRLTVIPDNQIVQTPLMDMHKLRLGGMLTEIPQVRTCLRHRPIDNTARMGSQEQ